MVVHQVIRVHIVKNKTIALLNLVAMVPTAQAYVNHTSVVAPLDLLAQVVVMIGMSASKNLVYMGHAIILMGVTRVPVRKVTQDKIAKVNTSPVNLVCAKMAANVVNVISIRTPATVLLDTKVKTAKRTSTTAQGTSVKMGPRASTTLTPIVVTVQLVTQVNIVSAMLTNVRKDLVFVKMGLHVLIPWGATVVFV